MIYRITRRTATNPTGPDLFVVVSDAIYNSPAVHLTTTYQTASYADMQSYIKTWLSANMNDAAGELLQFPWPLKRGQNTVLETALGKIFNFYDASPVQESGNVIASTYYASVDYPSFGTVDYSGTVSRITATNAGTILGYIQSWLAATNSFQGYFLIFPESVIHNGSWNFSSFTTSNYVGYMFFNISYTGGNYRISSYDLNYQHMSVNSTAITRLRKWNNITPEQYNAGDPYNGAGYPASSAPGGLSQGSFDFTEDGLTAVHTPSIDVLGSGLVTCWNPSIAQLAAVASWLWSTTPSDLLIKLLGNPINAIIGLNILPVQPDVDSGTNTIHFGPEDTAVAAPKCTSQYVTVDCGSLKIEPKYGSYMDYPPNTSAELFLPYCGGLKIDMYDVIDKTISIKYEVDILSGACVAYVFIDGVIHYQKSGMCAASVPVTGANMPNLITGVLNIVGTVATTAASMGASAAGPLTRFAAGATAGASVASSTANMLKTEISYAGTVAGWAGLLGSQTPYLIVTFPNCVIPGGMNMITGYPAWVSGRIGDFSGYTECKIDHVFALGATDAEVDEIKTLLEGGVIL